MMNSPPLFAAISVQSLAPVALQLATLFLGGVAALVLFVFLIRDQMRGVDLMLLMFVVDAVMIGFPSAEVAGFNIYPPDVVCSMLLAAALCRGFLKRFRCLHALWIAFAAISFLSFYHGLTTYGPKVSGVEFRPFFGLIAAVSYLSSFDLGALDFSRIKRSLYLAGAALVALAFYRWASEALGLPAFDSWSILRVSSAGRITRVLNSGETLYLLDILLVLAPSILIGRSSKNQQLASGILVILVIVLQQRTVWIATIAAFAYIFTRMSFILKYPARVAQAVVACSAALIIVLAVNSFGQVSDSLRFSVEEATASDSTFTWRVSSWQQLTADAYDADTAQLLLGSRPFGSGLIRFMDGRPVNLSAHNHYVEALMRVGVIGLVVFILFCVLLLWKLSLIRPQNPAVLFWHMSIVSIVIAQLVYFVGYPAEYKQGIVIGLGMSLLDSTAIRRRVCGGFAHSPKVALKQPVAQLSGSFHGQ